uniref:NADH-ubiquinone oxidoreductase chain 4 n=1 Tax=Abraeinae sp. MJTNT-2012 TaxID=1227474 RepID=S4SV25_9COLE|nr:NADH dehydrogenase subunit 4 [Abraeinae sp. MJTNT-2012]
MMKFVFMMIFMIPLCFNPNCFWLMTFTLFFMFIMFMMNFSFNYMFLNVSYFMGYDLLSFCMVLLSIWICVLMFVASYKLYMNKFYSNLFSFIMLLLLFSLIMTFGSMNLFIFYMFFEMSLIPTLFLILGWGYQPERLQAGIYLLFYTLLASLPMMISIFYLYNKLGSLDFNYFNVNFNSIYLYMCMIIVFLVKMPMYFIHLWLPKAHVEAPVSGSMILAGVMLKLGGYGLMRLMPIFLEIGKGINSVFITISLFGGFIVSLICLRQSDIKSLIAYSSVAHMGLVLGGIMTLNYWGLLGSLVMMIAHGLCSSGLFCLANINYERFNSRSLFINKGLINIMPSFSLWWFLLSSSNMAAPPSLNLAGEILLLNSLISYQSLNMLFISLISFFSAGYSLYLYSYCQHGKFYSGLYSFSMGSVREYILLMLHWLPLNMLVLKGEMLILWL